MPPPKTKKEVYGFLGRLNYIVRFISHLTATCEAIFKLPRKDQAVIWNDDCQEDGEVHDQWSFQHWRYQNRRFLQVPMRCILSQHEETGRKEHAIY